MGCSPSILAAENARITPQEPVLRLYWDADNVQVPSSADLDGVMTGLDNLCEFHKLRSSITDYKLVVVGNQTTFHRLTKQQAKKFDNWGVTMQMVADAREAADSAIVSAIRGDLKVFGRAKLQAVGIISKDRGFSNILREVQVAGVKALIISPEQLGEDNPLRSQDTIVVDGKEAMDLIFQPQTHGPGSSPPLLTGNTLNSPIQQVATTPAPPAPPTVSPPTPDASTSAPDGQPLNTISADKLKPGLYIGTVQTYERGKGTIEIHSDAKQTRLDYTCRVDFDACKVVINDPILRIIKNNKNKVQITAGQTQVKLEWCKIKQGPNAGKMHANNLTGVKPRT